MTDLVLFSTLGIIVRWSIGVRLLTSAESDQDDDGRSEPLPVSDVDDREASLYTSSSTTLLGSDQTPLLDPVPPRTRSPPKYGHGGLITPDSETGASLPAKTTTRKVRKSRSIFQSFPNTPVASARTSENGASDEGPQGDDSDEDEDDAEWGERRGVGRRDEDVEIFDGVWALRWIRLKRKTAVVTRPVKKVAKRIGAFVRSLLSHLSRSLD